MKKVPIFIGILIHAVVLVLKKSMAYLFSFWAILLARLSVGLDARGFFTALANTGGFPLSLMVLGLLWTLGPARAAFFFFLAPATAFLFTTTFLGFLFFFTLEALLAVAVLFATGLFPFWAGRFGHFISSVRLRIFLAIWTAASGE